MAQHHIGQHKGKKARLLACAVTAVPNPDFLPGYGDLLTFEQFLECVGSGGFIDYDGYGIWSDGMFVEGERQRLPGEDPDTLREECEELMWFLYGEPEPSHRPPQLHHTGVRPSNFTSGRHWKPAWATHVVWFNR